MTHPVAARSCADEPAHVVVAGSGIAGLTAALHAADKGCRVTLVTKNAREEANTRYAQGGIAAVMFEDDQVESHAQDTLVAGAGLCDPDAVAVLTSEGPGRVRELIALGVAFDRSPEGVLRRGLEAAHSAPRVLHAGGDATGAVIEAALVARVRQSGVAILEHTLVVDAVIDGGRVTGVTVLQERPGREGRRSTSDAPGTIGCDALVLATGGVGELYAHTTNPRIATGDGIAIARRAGARVRDLEFVQFHPTVLPTCRAEAGVGEAFLVSEAVRGEGAVLRDREGRRFMPDIHPDAELAPRDIVARAIAAQMRRQDGTPVLLDATGLRSDDETTSRFLAERFPTIDAAVRARGLDWSRTPIPVTPAAHYAMGGVETDLWGRTGVPGLYAVGEVARTGVHGANRLASNSLLEGAVFGARAGERIAADTLGARAGEPWPVDLPVPPRDAELPAAPLGLDADGFTRHGLQELMWAHVGLVRDDAGLRHAAAVIDRWERALPAPQNLRDHEDANLLLVAREIVAAARARTRSVGAHFRRDDTESPRHPIPGLRHGHAPLSGKVTA
ncbi:L-aspartate oxidase [Microbacterium sp. TNHR37B]|uniref:L-aspartate oxidase n=1 Tax=Microbacterium sp. TNHR37B TaxID=1775956 RepID=UPI0007B18627|nr:L-aspartate oxidase [Microbacterium sp. TNHR37B]KZE91310.1 L-aspartate oxidase [Microbacterium sp. TNHR37B]